MAEQLNAGDLCTRDVVFVYRSTPVDDVARLMRQHHVGSAVVVDETDAGRVVVGMLTDRDIVTTIVAKNLDPGGVGAGDAMSTTLATVREQDSLVEALTVMRQQAVRRLPVVDARGVLVGLLALDDVIEVVGQALHLGAQVIAAGRQREPARRP